MVVVTVGTTEAEVGVTMVLAWPGAMTVGRGDATVVGISIVYYGVGTTLCVCCGVWVTSPSNVTTLLSPPLLSHVTQAAGVQRFCAWQADYFTRLQFDRFLSFVMLHD